MVTSKRVNVFSYMEGGGVLGHGDVNKPSEGDHNPFTHEGCRLGVLQAAHI